MDKKVIFFIEDEKEIMDLYTAQLEGYGFVIESFKNGNEVLAKIESISKGESTPPSVIILDLLLPDISGLAILGELRGKPMFDDIPVIVFTNYVSESLQESVHRMDNVLYLSKIDTTPLSLLEIIRSKVH